MKKTTSMKKVGAAAMAMAMTTSMAMTAFAVPNPAPGMGQDGNFGSNTANTTVSVVGMTDGEINGNLSAEVPLTVLLAIGGGGDVRGPQNYSIKNNTQHKGIKVSKMKAEAIGNSYVVAGAASNTQVDLKAIELIPSLSGNAGSPITLGTMGATNGHDVPAANTDWTLAAAGVGGQATELGIEFSGFIDDVKKLPGDATTNAAGQQAFSVQYTIEAVAVPNP